MPCPFARFAALAADLDPKYSHYRDYHAHHPISSSSSSSSSSTSTSRETSPGVETPPLSEFLKKATAKAHREVESSQGVRQLMGFNDQLALGRLDYVRWMIMLACIYAAMESALLAQDPRQASLLGPLLSAKAPSSTDSSTSLVSHLIRFPSTMLDIQSHLQILAQSTGNEDGAGLTWTELMEDVQEQHAAMSQQDVARFQELKQLMAAVPQHALLSHHQRSATVPTSLTAEHIDLLTPAEAHATLVYTKRLLSLAAPSHASGTSPDLLLAHAYVRYLGDLSGGQHIKRRIEKLLPVSHAAGSSTELTDGFAFYAFDKPASMSGTDAQWHHSLKQAFRVAMDTGIDAGADDAASACTLMEQQGHEASLAFELNKDLFEAIIGNHPTTTTTTRASTAIIAPSQRTSFNGCPVTAIKNLVALVSPLFQPLASKAPSTVLAPPTAMMLTVHHVVIPLALLTFVAVVGASSIALA